MSAIKLSSLYVTQNSIRDLENVKQLIYKIEYSYRKIIDSIKGIKIARFDDGNSYIRDGTHRCLALYAVQKPISEPYLPSNLIDIEYYSYDEWEDINFECGWVTPIDIKQYVRKPDISSFKKEVFDILKKDGEDSAKEFICKNHNSFLEKRQLLTLEDVYNKYFGKETNEEKNIMGITSS